MSEYKNIVIIGGERRSLLRTIVFHTACRALSTLIISNATVFTLSPRPKHASHAFQTNADECHDSLASGAGSALVTSLVPLLPGTHRILLIDAFGFAFWPLSSLRASIQPGWEKRASAPLTTEAVFPSGSQHQVIAPCKVVELKEGFVVLEKEFEGSTEVPFWVSTPASVLNSSRSLVLAGVALTDIALLTEMHPGYRSSSNLPDETSTGNDPRVLHGCTQGTTGREQEGDQGHHHWRWTRGARSRRGGFLGYSSLVSPSLIPPHRLPRLGWVYNRDPACSQH